MTTETQVESTETTSKEEAAEQAAFRESIAAARNPDAVTERQDGEPEGEPTEVEEVKTKQEPESEPPVLAGLTADQLKAVLANAARLPDLEAGMQRRLDQAFGKIGEVIQQIQALPKAGDKPATPSAAGKLTAASLKRISEDFPELAEGLAADLSEIIGTGTSPDVDAKLSEALGSIDDRINQAVAKQLLSFKHPDYATIRDSQEHALWMTTLPEDERLNYLASWDATFIGDKLDDFKAWRTANATSKQQRNERLNAAIQPSGAGGRGPAPMTEDEAYRAALRAARRPLVASQ